MKAVFAAVGHRHPGQRQGAEAGQIRGVESHGMLCSARELGLGEDHDGIIELRGRRAGRARRPREVLGIEGPVIEVALTPNRADCFGVSGIARDLAAAGIGTLKPPRLHPGAEGSSTPADISLDFPTATRTPARSSSAGCSAA